MSTSADYRPSDNPFWQPMEDENGDPITFTDEQCRAIYHAMQVVVDVMRVEREKGRRFHVAVPAEVLEKAQLMQKSRLFGRLLKDGKPPLVDAPPSLWGGPDYSVEVPRGG